MDFHGFDDIDEVFFQGRGDVPPPFQVTSSPSESQRPTPPPNPDRLYRQNAMGRTTPLLAQHLPPPLSLPPLDTETNAMEYPSSSRLMNHDVLHTETDPHLFTHTSSTPFSPLRSAVARYPTIEDRDHFFPLPGNLYLIQRPTPSVYSPNMAFCLIRFCFPYS